MIEAYFDESGIHKGAKVCVIAGYFGYSAQWRALEKKWRKVLKDFNFPLKDFHATDLIDRRNDRSMLEKLAEAIARSEVYPVSSGIIVDDFYSFNETQRKFMTGATLMPSGKFKTSGAPNKPYFVPFQNAVKNITDYAKPGRRANFCFGLDRPMAKYADAFFTEIKTRGGWGQRGWASRGRLGDPAFPLAKETPQLQAADLFSHLSYRHMNERNDANDWNVLPTDLLMTCLHKMRSPYDHGYQTKDSLQAVLEQTYAISGNWDEH
jgi:hypothetical protein